jgi:deoxycytidylate deaminase
MNILEELIPAKTETHSLHTLSSARESLNALADVKASGLMFVRIAAACHRYKYTLALFPEQASLRKASRAPASYLIQSFGLSSRSCTNPIHQPSGAAMSDDKKGPNVVSAHLNGLLHIASLTNAELFPIVMSAINKYCRSAQPKQKGKKEDGSWKDNALRVAIDVAKGEKKCCCQECWVARYQELSSGESLGEKLSFADALKSLDGEACCKKRLENALNEVSLLQLSDITSQVSIRQVAGLIRASAHLKNAEDTTSVQVRAMSCLVKLMPQLETTSPSDIFLAIQQPILQKLSWDIFATSGIKFDTLEAESEFKSLLHHEFETQDDSEAHAGTKRKRVSETSIEPTHDNSQPSTIHYLLEAAHLARNGAVRAKHGAIIYMPTENGSTKIIGRGWNHDYLLNRSKHQKNKLNLHSEVHAVANAIQTYGEDECFNNLFPKSTIIIVELSSDYGYEASHPCPKCDPMLRAVGIPRVIHSTSDGKLATLDLGVGNSDFLKNENVSVALRAACNEQNVVCRRLDE